MSDPFASADPPTRLREARERAVELLYEAEMKQCDVRAVIDAQVLPPDPFALALALGVRAQLAELDALLGRLVRSDWPVQRLAVLDRWVLRLGLFELRRGLTPAAAVINEAVDLAHRWGATSRSPAFVNGILSEALSNIEKNQTTK